jgi:hypothetical protein
MPHSLIWLPSVLKEAGLKVALELGWEDRGHLPPYRRVEEWEHAQSQNPR